MKRLTTVTSTGKIYLGTKCPNNPKKGGIFCTDCPTKNFGEQMKVCPVIISMRRLAAYEDTSLTPAEIATLQQENAELKERIIIADGLIIGMSKEIDTQKSDISTLKKALRLMAKVICFPAGYGDCTVAQRVISAKVDYFIRQAKEVQDEKI